MQTCHRRGAHAIGGMAAFIPSRRDAGRQRRRTGQGARGQGARGRRRVRRDVGRASRPGAAGEGDVRRACSGERPNQKDRLREDVHVERGGPARLRASPGGRITEAGVRANVASRSSTSTSWLRGTGAAAIYNLMEDAATAEISRSQLWLWRKRGATAGRRARRRYGAAADDPRRGAGWDPILRGGCDRDRLDDAAALLDDLVLGDAYPEFLTLGAYPLLDRG